MGIQTVEEQIDLKERIVLRAKNEPSCIVIW